MLSFPQEQKQDRPLTKKEQKEAGDLEALPGLIPPQERAWGALVVAVSEDAAIPAEHKPFAAVYTQKIASPELLRGTVLSCMTKKAYRQRSWPSDKWKIELLVVPEITEVMLVFTAPGMEAHATKLYVTPARDPKQDIV